MSKSLPYNDQSPLRPGSQATATLAFFGNAASNLVSEIIQEKEKGDSNSRIREVKTYCMLGFSLSGSARSSL